MKALPSIQVVFLMSLLLVLGACAPTSMTPPTGKPDVVQTNPLEAVKSLEDDIAAAKQDQLPLLSPDRYAAAEEFYENAKKGAESGSEISKIMENVANGKGALQQARETAKVARTMLTDVIESRNKAHVAGAAELGSDYATAETDFMKLTRAIEANNIGYTKRNAPKVSQAYLDLELRAIKASTIERVRPLLEQAETEKAPKYVPQSLTIAHDYFDETDQFITANRYAEKEINQKVQESMFAAKRALVLNSQSKSVELMKPEQIALWMEENLHQVTTQLAAEDVRDQGVNIQVSNILQSIQSLQDENSLLKKQLNSQKEAFSQKSASYESNIAALNQRIAELEGTALTDQKVKADLLAEQRAIEQKLTAEREFNKKYLEVQTFFTTDEAEVYKQRNQLIIRLKAMKFPVGTAIIVPENYALLSKVQQAIQTFEGPSIMIEGHTDSTGQDEANEALSRQRAEAVRDYLVANKTIPPDKIHFKGYGSTRPLASNATPEGRAINRRIDVVINPSVASGQ